MDILAILVVGALNVACFFIGAKVGQAVVKEEKLEFPTINPMKIIHEHREQKAAEQEKSKFEAILRNIDCYDGTSTGQQDIP